MNQKSTCKECSYASKTIWVLLLTLSLVAFTGSTSLVTAGGNPPDPPHATHLTDARGPHIGTEVNPYPGSACDRCHTGSPAWNNVDTGVCGTCHTTGGEYDGVSNLTVGALKNWENMPGSSAATQSLVYNTDGTLKDGKELWCASCHDQTETGTAIIDGFEGSLVGWGSTWDIDPDRTEVVSFWGSEGSAGMERGIKGRYLNLWLDWDQNPTVCAGRAWKNLNPAVDFSNRDSFNFYLKFSDFGAYAAPDGILGVIIRLKDADTGQDSICQFYVNYEGDPDPDIKINGFVDRVWKLVSLPREVFSNPNWGMVQTIGFDFYETGCSNGGSPPGEHYQIVVHLDEIGCDITGANVWGDNQTRGCSTTGHEYCAWCHDSTREHVDYNRLTIWEYIKADTRIEGEYDEHINPTEFRFYDRDDMKMRLALKKYDCEEYANEYGLCFQCHREDWVRGDIQGQIDQGLPHTNFYNEYGNNLHNYHVPCITTRLTCVSCHDPHGQSSMAMMRDEMGGMIYLDAEENPCTIEYGADSDGDGKMDWHDPDINKAAAQTRGGGGDTVETTAYVGAFCVTCHSWPLDKLRNEPDENGCYTYPFGCGSDIGCQKCFYVRDYAYVPHSDEMNCFDAGCHVVNQMHAAHFVPDPGPDFPLDETGCYYCHADGHLQCQEAPKFADNEFFADTTVCDACHSGGSP